MMKKNSQLTGKKIFHDENFQQKKNNGISSINNPPIIKSFTSQSNSYH